MMSDVGECDVDLWLSASAARTVAAMTEQVLWQRNGYALVMLHADIIDDDDRELVEKRNPPWAR